MITLPRFGNELLAFLPGDAPMVPAEDAHIPLTFTQVAIRHEGKIVLMFDRGRQQWEMPGGGIEPGEHPDDCARREVLEESGQTVEILIYKGLFKLHFVKEGRMEYGALYTATLRELSVFEGNEESEKIALWDGIEGLEGHISDLSRALLSFC